VRWMLVDLTRTYAFPAGVREDTIKYVFQHNVGQVGTRDRSSEPKGSRAPNLTSVSTE
jgi:hypothetical protein